MRSKADETFVIVEALICPLQISQLFTSLNYCFSKFSVMFELVFSPNSKIVIEVH